MGTLIGYLFIGWVVGLFLSAVGVEMGLGGFVIVVIFWPIVVFAVIVKNIKVWIKGLTN